MNIRIFLLTLNLVFIAVALSVAQQVPEVRYYDENFKPSTKGKAAYYRVAEPDSTGNPVRKVRDYYINGKLQWEGQVRKEYLFVADAGTGTEGWCTWYYPDGNIKERGFYQNGKTEGVYTSYFDNGKVQQEMPYTGGLRNGKGKTWYESGNLGVEFEYKLDKEDGVFLYYYDQTDSLGGKLMLERKVFVNARMNGDHIRYFLNGDTAFIETYSDSLLEGEQISYYENDSVMDKSNYRKGKLQGPKTSFYSDGTLKSRVNFIDGKEEGESTGYHPNGKISYRKTFRNGLQTGEETTYRESGSLWMQGHYLSGKRDGDYIYYSDTGTVSNRLIYTKGKFVSEESWSGRTRTLVKYTSDTIYNRKIWNAAGTLILDENHFGSGYSRMEYDNRGILFSAKLPDSLVVHPVKDNVSCLYGFKNYKNKWVHQPQFTTYSESGRYYIVTTGTKSGVLNYRGDLIIPVEWDILRFFAPPGILMNAQRTDSSAIESYSKEGDYIPSAGVFRAGRKGQLGILNRDGKMLLPLEYDEVTDMGNGYIRTRKDSLFGFADTSGFIISPRYRKLGDFNADGYALIPHFIRNKQRQTWVYGAINTRGDTIIPCLYEWISSEKTYQLIWVGNGNKIGAYTQQGVKVFDTEYALFDPRYGYYQNPKFSSDSLTWLQKGTKYGLLKANGQIVVPFIYDYLAWIPNRSAGDTVRWILKKDSKWSLAGIQGVSNISYDDLQYIETKMGNEACMQKQIYFVARQNDKYGIVDEENVVVIPFQYEYAFVGPEKDRNQTVYLIRNDSLTAHDCRNFKQPFSLSGVFSSSGILTFCEERRSGESGFLPCVTVNSKGKVILKSSTNTGLSSGRFLVYKNKADEPAIMDETGAAVWPPGHLSQVLSTEGDLAYIVSANEYAGLLDMEQKRLLVDTVYTAITNYDFNHHICWVKKNLTPDSLAPEEEMEEAAGIFKYIFSGWQLIDTNQRLLNKEEFDYPAAFSEEDSLATVFQKSHRGILKSDGKLLFPCKYEDIRRQRNGLYLVQEGGWGLAKATGEMIVSPQWEDVSNFIGNYFVFWSDGKMGIADTAGKIVVPPDSDLSRTGHDLAEYFYMMDHMRDQEGNLTWDEGIDTVFIGGFNKLMDYYAVHPERRSRKIVFNHLLTLALQNLKFGNSSESHNYPGLNYDQVFYCKENYNPELVDFFGCMESTTNTVDLSEITGSTFSYSVLDEFNASCSRGAGTYEASRTYFNFGIASADSVFPIALEDIFEPESNYREKLNALLLRKIADLENVELDCSNPEAYIDMVENRFSLSSKGITFYLNPDGDSRNYDSESEIELFIPYTSLTSVRKKTGIMPAVK